MQKAVTSTGAVFLLYVSKDCNLSRNDIELFGFLRTDDRTKPSATAAQLLLFGNIVDYLLPRQIVGNRFPAPLLPLVGLYFSHRNGLFFILIDTEAILSLIEKPPLQFIFRRELFTSFAEEFSNQCLMFFFQCLVLFFENLVLLFQCLVLFFENLVLLFENLIFLFKLVMPDELFTQLIFEQSWIIGKCINLKRHELHLY